MAVKLSARMMALADLVTPGTRLADVGTDHGYIPVFLCQTGKIPGAIAMDVNRGPLQRAEAHVKEYGLQEKIWLRLSDGLCALAPGEADTILIAGMGGALVRRILSGGAAVLASNPELILQPQSEIPSVRAFIREIGYVIVDEDCVLEDGKFYFPMKACRTEKAETGQSPCDPAGEWVVREAIPEKRGTDSEFAHTILEDAFGPVLLRKKHPTLCLYLERELAVAKEICETLADRLALPDAGVSPRSHLETRLQEVKARAGLIEKALRICAS